MAKKHNRMRNVALLVAVVPALAGCKLLGINHGFASNASLHERLPEDFGEQQLADGRKALTDGDTMAAIESFQLARLYPAQAAAAMNGLAVAYSRLGRTDLTERYFREAIALAPEDERFRANLARFYARNPVPPVADPNAMLAVLQPGPSLVAGNPVDVAVGSAAAVETGGIVQSEPAGRLRRVSRNEVVITDAPTAGNAVRPTGSRQAVIEVGSRTPRAPAIRVGLQTVTVPNRPAYPVKIQLSPR